MTGVQTCALPICFPVTIEFSQIFTSIAIFFAVLLLLFGAAGRVNGKAQRPLAILIFFGPAAILLLFGLVSPAIQTIIYSFKDADSISYVGFDNYTWMIQDESIRTVLFNNHKDRNHKDKNLVEEILNHLQKKILITQNQTHRVQMI